MVIGMQAYAGILYLQSIAAILLPTGKLRVDRSKGTKKFPP